MESGEGVWEDQHLNWGDPKLCPGPLGTALGNMQAGLIFSQHSKYSLLQYWESSHVMGTGPSQKFCALGEGGRRSMAA